MRYSFLLMVIIVLSVVASGCLQPPAPSAPPAPAPTLFPSIEPPFAGQREINVTVWTTESSVIVRYDGGRDAAALSLFRVQIDNRDGRIVKRSLYSPEIGREYSFPYTGIVNPNSINIIGAFADGTEQTVLIKYF